MSITTAQQTEILQITQAMFGASPGAAYLASFANNVAEGISISGLAQSLAGTSVFMGKSYSTSLDTAQFADAFVTDLVADRASTADKAWATSYITSKMAAGSNQGEIILELTQALSSVAADNTSWGAAATFYNTSNATTIVNNLVGNSATADAKSFAVNFIVSQMAAGQTFGQMVEWAITALDGVDHADATWGSAATLFDNRVEVSDYYSVTKAGASTDLGTLQQTLAGITTSASSVDTAKAMFNVAQSGKASRWLPFRRNGLCRSERRRHFECGRDQRRHRCSGQLHAACRYLRQDHRDRRH